MPPQARDHNQAASAGQPGARLSKAAKRMLWPLAALGMALVMVPVLFKSNRGRRSNKSRATAPPPFHPGLKSPPPLPPVAPSGKGQADRAAIGLTTRCDTLLSPAELSFFHVLEKLVAHRYRVSYKVRLADLFNVKLQKGHQSALNKITAKHVDFVVCEPSTSKVIAAIELDDRSHAREDRVQRDHFVNDLFAEHGLPLLRVPAAWSYNPVGVRAELAKAGLEV
jgi:hypothetical protein